MAKVARGIKARPRAGERPDNRADRFVAGLAGQADAQWHPRLRAGARLHAAEEARREGGAAAPREARRRARGAHRAPGELPRHPEGRPVQGRPLPLMKRFLLRFSADRDRIFDASIGPKKRATRRRERDWACQSPRRPRKPNG